MPADDVYYFCFDESKPGANKKAKVIGSNKSSENKSIESGNYYLLNISGRNKSFLLVTDQTTAAASDEKDEKSEDSKIDPVNNITLIQTISRRLCYLSLWFFLLIFVKVARPAHYFRGECASQQHQTGNCLCLFTRNVLCVVIRAICAKSACIVIFVQSPTWRFHNLHNLTGWQFDSSLTNLTIHS